MINKKYALEIQTELKTIASQILQDWGGVDVESFGWGIEYTDDNYLDGDIWYGNGYIYGSEEREPGVFVKYIRSIICVTDIKEKAPGLCNITVKVDLPEEYGLPVKIFKGEYHFFESNPMDVWKGFPDALYEAYLYFAEVTNFSYGEKISYLTGAMWEFASAYEIFCHLDCFEILGKFAKSDIVD